MKKAKVSGVNTSELPHITNEKIIELFKSWQNGAAEARERLIHSNLRLVLSVLKRFEDSKYSGDDLFQVGCMGLVKAVDNFDLGRGVCFSTYAVPMIIGEIKRFIRDNKKIRVSRSIRNTAHKILTIREELKKRLNREPRINELADELDISCQQIAYALEAVKSPLSLAKPMNEGQDEPLRLIDQIEDKIDFDIDKWIDMEKSIFNLSKREKLIIILKFWYGYTQAEIGQRLDISQAQVSRLQKKALEKIKQERNYR